MMSNIRIATRTSALALWQANHVAARLQGAYPGLATELVPIVTTGDRHLETPLAALGGKGLFLKELELALLDGRADIAVHSMKDVPAQESVGLTTAVVLERANPYDALVSPGGISLNDLPPGAVVGTSSMRRQSQLLAARPDLTVADLRGNVNTRLQKLEAGQYDAIVLACAGLERLGLAEHIGQQLGIPEWLPAASQGTIGIQCRADDQAVGQTIAVLQHPDTATVTRAERRVAELLQGSCRLPLAAHAILEGDTLSLWALVGTPDGGRLLRSHGSGPAAQPDTLGGSVAEELLAQGAAEIIAAIEAGA